MSNGNTGQLLESLPFGNVLQTVFVELSGTVVSLVQLDDRRALFARSRADARYRELDLEALGDTRIEFMVAPVGVDFLVCVAKGKVRVSALPPVATHTTCWVVRLDLPECSEFAPSEHPSHWVMRLLGAGQVTGTVLCIACKVENGIHQGKPAIIPRYGVALIHPELHQLSVLEPDIGPIF